MQLTVVHNAQNRFTCNVLKYLLSYFDLEGNSFVFRFHPFILY